MSELKKMFDYKISEMIQEISPHDEMYLGNKEHYFHVGNSAIQCIKMAILSSGRDFSDIKKILDLPCGYGRVMRMLKEVFPKAKLTGCDLLRDGVDFCSKMFNVSPIYSEKRIKNVKIRDKFDLIWCGSLLTHLDHERWPDFIEFFNDSLESNGIFIVTTHGRYVAEAIRSNKSNYGIEDSAKLNKMVNDFYLTGFGYSNYPNSEEYGISLSSSSFVLSMFEKYSRLRVISYIEKGWDNHQDVIACVKDWS